MDKELRKLERLSNSGQPDEGLTSAKLRSGQGIIETESFIIKAGKSGYLRDTRGDEHDGMIDLDSWSIEEELVLASSFDSLEDAVEFVHGVLQNGGTKLRRSITIIKYRIVFVEMLNLSLKDVDRELERNKLKAELDLKQQEIDEIKKRLDSFSAD